MDTSKDPVFSCPHCGRVMTYHTAQGHLRTYHRAELAAAMTAARKKSPLMRQQEMPSKW